MNWVAISLITLLTGCFTDCLNAQAYFKISDATDLLDQKIAEFRNGDLLIGNSSTAPLRTGNENGVLILERIDFCGNSIWIKEYNYADGYLELKDIGINDNDDIFLYGSHYKGLTESIFLSKIEIGAIDVADFKVFNPGTVDHFTYSLDLHRNELLIYGLLLDFNSSKQGFIAVFDQNLNFKQASKFVPFESTGEALFSENGGVVARSGPYVYKFDPKHNPEWAFNTIDMQDLLNISGPFETTDGWIFESHSNGISFLYLLNTSGDLIWKSDQIEKTNIGGDLSLMQDGHLLFSYNVNIESRTEMSFLTLDMGGTTLEEKKLQHSYTANTGTIKQRISGKDVSVIGSKNLFSTGTADVENFVIQFKLEGPNDSCFDIVNSTNVSNNNKPINFDPLAISPEDFDMILLESVRLNSETLDMSKTDLCNVETQIPPIVESNLLPCGEDWSVSLPNNNYRWDDGFENMDRVISEPGIYSARNIDCLQQELLEYRLEKEECGCHIYVPTIFSPNGDDTNDTLKLGVFCDLESFHVVIFNKWGEQVFESRTADQMWTGKVVEKDASPGIYSVLLTYTWFNGNDELESRKIIQTINLIR